MKVEFGSTEVGRIIFPFSHPPSDDGNAFFETPRISQHVTSPMVFSGIFSAAECDNIIKFGESLPLRTGQMMDARPNCRRSA